MPDLGWCRICDIVAGNMDGAQTIIDIKQWWVDDARCLPNFAIDYLLTNKTS